MARRDDFNNPPPGTTKWTRKGKRKRARRRAETDKAGAKKSATAKRAVRTVTVELLGVTYAGWYWVENDRLFVTYHEQPKVAEVECSCCSPAGRINYRN